MIYDTVFTPLFTYDRNIDIVQVFCEAWRPRTNTLITSSSEMSISLRDLYMLGGLPLSGDIYDEHIPNAVGLGQGLTQMLKTRRYAAPPPRKDNKKSRPKATHNLSEILEAASRWSHVSEAPFVELRISRNLEHKVYLATFPACWLCTFVLSSKPTATIRPETFKMACKMAKGIKAIPPPPPATASRQIPTQSSICCAADLELESVAVDRKPEAASVDREPEAASIECELEAVAADREPESTVADREPESTVADREPESTVADRSESIKARLLLIKPLAAELRWVGVGRKALRHGVSCCTSHAADENCASAKSSD
nr:uncharacterized protein LOC105949899 [Ipomoea trifida]